MRPIHLAPFLAAMLAGCARANVETFFAPDPQGSKPAQSVALAADGAVLTCDLEQIYRLDDDGKPRMVADSAGGSQFGNPVFVEPGAGQTVYFSDREEVLKVSPGGMPAAVARLPKGRRHFEVHGLAGDGKGTVYVLEREQSDNVAARWHRDGKPVERLSRVGPDGQVKAIAAAPEAFHDPRGLTLMRNGSLLLVTHNGQKLVEVHPRGYTRGVALKGATITALSFDNKNRLYGAGEDKVYAIAPDGACTCLNPDTGDDTPSLPLEGGALKGANLGTISDLACDAEGRLLLAERWLRRVAWSWPSRPAGRRWGGKRPGWSAWAKLPAPKLESAKPAEPEELARPHYPAPRPGQPRLPVLDEVIIGEDLFDSAAKLRKRFRITRRDDHEVPEFGGTFLGHPSCTIRLHWPYGTSPLMDATWPLDRLDVEIPAAGNAAVAPLWLAVCKQLVPSYGTGKAFTEGHYPENRFVTSQGVGLPLPRALPAPSVQAITAGKLSLSLSWKLPKKVWLELNTQVPPRQGKQPAVIVSLYQDPN